MSFSPQIFTNVINSYLPEPQASLLNGIIFGVPLKTTKHFYNELKAVGLLHLVVLSGSNITLLADFVAISTIRFGRYISTLIAILTIIIFVIFVGPQAPIVRAAIMGILTLVAIIYGRETIALYSLFLSGLFIGIFWPHWIKTVSFQLSFGATLGLILFANKLGGRHKREKDGLHKFISYIREELAITISAQIFTAPIIFIYFNQLSLVSPAANIAVAWTVAPLMVLGFLASFLGKFWHPLGIIPAWLSYGILKYFVWIVDILSKIPGGFINFKK